ncbi:MAG TPA: trypsin-like peptidase domain-containing protein [Candidatus Limnocylindria bacterium]|nr:trypsin-like peptidase domain-containing protein [Candidatus Limnocylindria bacterium]
MALLEELQDVIARVAQSAGPAVVRIGGGWRGGSGVVVASGYVLTNAHNVRSDNPTVTFGDGRREQARVHGLDVDGDLAVLAVETGGSQAVEWADQPLGLGSPVLALALNGGGPRVTFGTVSSIARAFHGPRGRPISGGLEHTAPLAPGSSGGPLLDSQGRLAGINTNRLGGGFYVALPADEALRQRVAALQRGETIERPRLGVAIAPERAARRLRRAVGLPERDGLLVRGVEVESPAEQAGIQEGDLLIEADGQALRSADELYAVLGRLEPGMGLRLVVVRGTEERSAEVTFAAVTGEEGEAGPVH